VRTRVEELFGAVADFSDEARQRYFAEQNLDESTRAEVEALLAFDETRTSALDADIASEASRALERIDVRGARYGAYQIKDLLGRGGMGTVYSAERVDGEILQRVAVKLLRSGGEDPQLRRRFSAERQILAALSHPNIARLLDAGHREGQPYFVMEYVEGEPIDAYTAESSIRQKIKIFLKVCAAVAYLHQNLVVHRDLKPQNILVTKDGEPKLLDFGIAKILEKTMEFTLTGFLMLTPDYASPEQVTGTPVTTATDVYSLGAVLYKLLTGDVPHRFPNNSVEAIASTICKGDITPPIKLAPALKRDLETIVMKAMRREPQERYTSVEQFAEDLENFLESRPVRARKGGAIYRARKFLGRYWIPATASALAIVSLAAGLTFANHERAIAQRRFEEVRQLANKLFDIDLEARKVPGNTKVRQTIVDMSLDYLRRLGKDSQGDPDLQLELGNAYMRVARVQGVPISANLGQMDQAAQNLGLAENLIQAALKARPTNRTALLRAAQITHDRMLLARFNSQDDKALDFARRSADWLRKFNAGPGDKPDAPAILVTYLNVAHQHMLGYQFSESLRLCDEAIELARVYNSPLYVGTFRWTTGEVYRRQGDLDRALKETDESAEALGPALEKKDQNAILNLVLALTYKGRILGEADAISMGRSQEALAALERAFDIADGFVHRDPIDQSSRGRVAMAGTSIGAILRRMNPPKSLQVYDHVLTHMAEIQNNASFRRFEVTALVGSSEALLELGRKQDAQERLNDAFERLNRIGAYPAERLKPGSEPDHALTTRARFEAMTGNYSQSITDATKLMNGLLAWPADGENNLADAVDLSRVYGLLADVQWRAGHSALAVEWESRRRGLWQQWDAKLPSNPFIQRQMEAARNLTRDSAR
jgi:tRNA A-37 threonylcarbamoyl transferase component Bud32/tetratricopeptide (TPR) repeat protein